MDLPIFAGNEHGARRGSIGGAISIADEDFSDVGGVSAAAIVQGAGVVTEVGLGIVVAAVDRACGQSKIVDGDSECLSVCGGEGELLDGSLRCGDIRTSVKHHCARGIAGSGGPWVGPAPAVTGQCHDTVEFFLAAFTVDNLGVGAMCVRDGENSHSLSGHVRIGAEIPFGSGRDNVGETRRFIGACIHENDMLGDRLSWGEFQGGVGQAELHIVVASHGYFSLWRDRDLFGVDVELFDQKAGASLGDISMCSNGVGKCLSIPAGVDKR